MRNDLMRILKFWTFCFAAAGICSEPLLGAQLVRQDPPAQAQSSAPKPAPSPVQMPTGKRRVSQEFQITGDQVWVDTGIAVQAGEHVVATASGKLRYADANEENGPEGLARGFKDLLRILPYNGAARGALLGRFGDPATAQPFLLGGHCNVVSYTGGQLSLGINQTSTDTGDGTYTVRVEIYAPDASFVPVRQVTTMPGIDASLFSKIPRRVADKDGNPGDMVNFLVLGSEDAMQKVFTTAGWVKVDADVRGSVLHGIIESISKESYLTMPMSPLYLFGRTQDFGWAHAEPITVVASRNHLRIWKAPFQVNGQTLWVGAATHDVGFERDQRNNGVTHKIDPDIDVERDYVEKTLVSTGLVLEVTHFLPERPMKEAKTATGGSFHSNGKVLVLKLTNDAKPLSARSAH
jgi:hypothetical protein